MMDNRYYISSNGEPGEGRYDIQLSPKSANMPGILIELKAARKLSGDKLKQLLETALAQIEDRKYDTDMLPRVLKQSLSTELLSAGNRWRLRQIPYACHCAKRGRRSTKHREKTKLQREHK